VIFNGERFYALYDNLILSRILISDDHGVVAQLLYKYVRRNTFFEIVGDV
jgi:hypothetical protein